LQGLYYPQVPNYFVDAHERRHQDNFTQELRLTSNGDGRLNWVAGIYYANDREVTDVYQYEPLANALELALFGQTIQQHFGNAPINGNINGIDNRVTSGL
jgi:hypothetical protein